VFSPKTKRELLKSKVLIRKTGQVEIGMISTLQEEMSADSDGVRRTYRLKVKVYLTACAALAQLKINVQVPAWLSCSDGQKEKSILEEQAQFIAHFSFQLAKPDGSLKKYG
jgi:hypothetical protein